MTAHLSSPVRIYFTHGMFDAAERTLVETPHFRVATFLYPTGVEGVRVTSERVALEFLPFQGQEVWRYAVDGVDQTMRTNFAHPYPTTVFGATYGPFMLHCGLTGIGHPGPEDTHAHHGELPNIAHDEAWVEIAQTADGETLTLGGKVDLIRTHALNTRFEPRVTLTQGRSVMRIDARVTNNRTTPIEYAYLNHINWPLIDGTLYQTCTMNAEDFRVYMTPGADVETVDYIQAITEDPVKSAHIDHDTPLNPEYCAYVTPLADDQGWAHFLLAADDGTGRVVRQKIDRLPHAIRWLSNTGDEVAAGFCLPSTSHHKGTVAALEEGLMVTLEAGEAHDFAIELDVLDEAATEEAIALIDRVNAG